jgi:tape measure domain-containing protein
MPSVDDRIVRMEFDNAAFEKKIATTLTSLDKLNKSLKFEGAQKGLADLSTNAGKFSLHGLSDGVENVSKKFIALSTIAITALATITTRAVEAGIHLTKAFSLDPIIDGFREYETQLNSVQTILANTASKGTTLDQVNEALAQLNEYSDQTIYNFGQMARNIGTFTAAGVDLDTSVNAIKGIANLAAMSGSSSEQASTAMYQLSQAIASGSVKLMDWNSVVNAGMGGEAFQTALFETGKAMGTLVDVPLDQSLKEWTDSGNSFRDSLKDGWITADVLTTTLAGFTGDLTEEMLIAKGYSQEQASNIMKTAAIAKAAATEVKTFSQLIGTVKEAVGTGWADSFKIVIGNFTEAKELWTGVNNSIGTFVKTNADARNALLQGWKDLGGRTLLIDSISTAIKNLGEIIAPIKEAFREIFPPMTAERLFSMTEAFSRFAEALKPSAETVDNLKRIFKGFFSILEIGWEIVKQGAQFIGDLFSNLTGAGSGQFLAFIADIGDFFTGLNESLVEGGGITAFFDNLSTIVERAIGHITDFKDKVLSIFDDFKPGAVDAVSDGFGRVESRFENLRNLLDRAGNMWEPFKNALMKVVDVLEVVWEAISTWFEELGEKLAAVMEPGDFDAAVDAVNVGLLGGIAALLAKFIKEGFTFDIGSGFFEKVGKSFEELTGVLSAMQTSIKADALLKIAGAIALLTASVVTLSLIDSAALTKSLAAMAVGFGQLMASFAVLSKMAAGPKGAASLVLLSGAMVAISAAILILAGAAAIMASIDAEDLARGLGGLVAMLATMTTVAIILSKNSGSLIGASIGMIAIGVAITILAGAVKLFSMMSWTDIAKGMASVAGGLVIIALAMRLMPGNMILQGAGLLMVATSLSILAGAVKLFSMMSWEEIGKGMAAIAGGLLIIAGAMHLMPATLPLTGAGLILVGIGLGFLADAMGQMSEMDWDDIGRGLVAMAGALLILAVATNAMTGAIGGAIAIGIVSVSMLVLAKVLKEFAKIEFSDLLRGLIGIAASLAVLGIAAMLLQPALGPMMLLGAALILIGGGFALFGVGASLVAEAFERLAKSGAAGSEALVTVLENLGKAIPAFLGGLLEALLGMVDILVEAAPVFVKALVVILGHLLEGITELIPQAEELIKELITSLLDVIVHMDTEIIEAGLALLTSLLTGIRDNIDDVTILVGEIITEFLDAFGIELTAIVQSVATLITNFFEDVAYAVGLVAATLMVGVGIQFINGFIDGLEQQKPTVESWFTGFPAKVVQWIGNVLKTLWQKGVDLITGLLKGVTDKAIALMNWFKGLAKNIVSWVGNTISTLWQKGVDLISGLLKGITDRIKAVSTYLGGLASSLAGWVGNTLSALWQKGVDIISGLWDGIKYFWEVVKMWLGSIPVKVSLAVGNLLSALWQKGVDVIQGFWNGLKSKWDAVYNWFKEKIEALKSIPGIGLFIKSPSRYMYWIGEMIVAGLANAIRDDKSVDVAMTEFIDGAKDTLDNSIALITESLGSMTDFNPTITPVLDLTNVETEAKKIGDYIKKSQVLVPALSTRNANVIATSGSSFEDDSPIKSPSGSGEVKFEQNIYAPKQLSTEDIYRQTRNQITMAKQELSIP